MDKGFYKFQDILFYGPNFVHGPTFKLIKEEKDLYNYPVDDWYWFDSLEEACIFFGLNINDYIQNNTEEQL